MKTRAQITQELLEITNNIGGLFGEEVRITVLMAADIVRLYGLSSNSLKLLTALQCGTQAVEELDRVLSKHSDDLLTDLIFLVGRSLEAADVPTERHREFYKTISLLVERMMLQESLPSEQSNG